MPTRFVSLAICVAAATSINAQQVRHPSDPLTFGEYWTILETLDAAGKLDKDTRFPLILLDPPEKTATWAFKSGDAIPRSALAVVRQGPKTYEAHVDMVSGKLSSWDHIEGMQPNWLDEEFSEAAKPVLENDEFLAALDKRGFKNLAFVKCSGGPPGYFGTEEQKGRRVAHVKCQDLRDRRNNWTRQIEGLSALVDLNEKKVLRVIDEGVVPVPDTNADYDAASIGKFRHIDGKLELDQPDGPGFQLESNFVSWQGWRFHVRPDQRAGPVLSLVTYQQGGAAPRPILYEGHLAEIFVPYMDPAFHWYQRNFLDAGEFPAGGLLKPLIPGKDCPGHAIRLDAIIHDDHGRPKTVANAICIFERETGDMAWRHHSDEPESRVQRDLVVRSAAVLGNYDYVFDWTFQQSGVIRVAVGATGIVEAKMTTAKGAKGPNAGWDASAPDAWGRFVDDHVIGVNHDHYFNFRLDLDVDGPVNRFSIDRLVTKELPADHPRRSVWVRDAVEPATEKDAKLTMHMHQPSLWRVLSGTSKNGVGYPTSYQLMPGMSAVTLLSEDDFPRRRAGFIDHHLWVTPYDRDQRWAAGDYPTLSTPGQGLPAYTAAGREIQNQDLVVWHTIGMHHLVRAEDWPIMPVLWHSFELRPFDFFDRNPALDLPR